MCPPELGCGFSLRSRSALSSRRLAGEVWRSGGVAEAVAVASSGHLLLFVVVVFLYALFANGAYLRIPPRQMIDGDPLFVLLTDAVGSPHASHVAVSTLPAGICGGVFAHVGGDTGHSG